MPLKFNALAKALLNVLLYLLYLASFGLKYISEISVPSFYTLPNACVLINLLLETLKPGRVVKILELLPRKVNLLVYGLLDESRELRRRFAAELLKLLD